jgi:nitroreductase
MDALEAIRQRCSVRQFRREPVAREVLEQLVDCGRLAPTAMAKEPWEFVVVTSEETRRNIAGATDYGKFIADAPACIAVFCRDTKYYLEDGCAAVQNILVAAAALGLGACWVAGDKKSYAGEVRRVLRAPEDCNLVALLPIGYPAEEMVPRKKRPLGDVLHWDSF